MSYLVRFRKAEDITGDYISLAVPGDTTTAVLPHLFPLTAYEVNVFAQYEKGDSFPLTGEETTLEGKRLTWTLTSNVIGIKEPILMHPRVVFCHGPRPKASFLCRLSVAMFFSRVKVPRGLEDGI